QAGGGFGFAAEALEELVVAGQVGRQDLDGDGLVVVGMLAEVDVAHAAAAEALEDAGLADGAADHLVLRRAGGAGDGAGGARGGGGRVDAGRRRDGGGRGAGLGWRSVRRHPLSLPSGSPGARPPDGHFITYILWKREENRQKSRRGSGRRRDGLSRDRPGLLLGGLLAGGEVGPELFHEVPDLEDHVSGLLDDQVGPVDLDR